MSMLPGFQLTGVLELYKQEEGPRTGPRTATGRDDCHPASKRGGRILPKIDRDSHKAGFRRHLQDGQRAMYLSKPWLKYHVFTQHGWETYSVTLASGLGNEFWPMEYRQKCYALHSGMVCQISCKILPVLSPSLMFQNAEDLGMDSEALEDARALDKRILGPE